MDACLQERGVDVGFYRDGLGTNGIEEVESLREQTQLAEMEDLGLWRWGFVLFGIWLEKIAEMAFAVQLLLHKQHECESERERFQIPTAREISNSNRQELHLYIVVTWRARKWVPLCRNAQKGPEMERPACVQFYKEIALKINHIY